MIFRFFLFVFTFFCLHSNIFASDSNMLKVIDLQGTEYKLPTWHISTGINSLDDVISDYFPIQTNTRTHINSLHNSMESSGIKHTGVVSNNTIITILPISYINKIKVLDKTDQNESMIEIFFRDGTHRLAINNAIHIKGTASLGELGTGQFKATTKESYQKNFKQTSIREIFFPDMETDFNNFFSVLDKSTYSGLIIDRAGKEYHVNNINFCYRERSTRTRSVIKVFERNNFDRLNSNIKIMKDNVKIELNQEKLKSISFADWNKDDSSYPLNIVLNLKSGSSTTVSTKNGKVVAKYNDSIICFGIKTISEIRYD